MGDRFGSKEHSKFTQAMRSIYRILLILALAAAPSLSAARGTILVLGDSLSAAFGIEERQGWVQLLQQRLHEERYDYRVVNGSISGETTAGGLARLAPLLNTSRPEIVIVELGINDGLRGLPLDDMRENLRQIILQARQQGAKVLLVGMRLPPNYGSAYTRLFHDSYRELSRQLELPLVPFFMQGLRHDPTHFQEDNLHPTAAAQPILLENIWQKLVPLLNLPQSSGSPPK